MPYLLTLSAGERKAIDWVGDRYRHGDELYSLLWTECQSEDNSQDWDDPDAITFVVPEPAAWVISEIVEEDGLACFGDDLRSKLYEFVGKIV